jgi:hypothetical protein
MPKKGGKVKKSSQKRPEWMSEELFALSQNPTQLIDNFRGTSEKNTVPVTIPKDQVNFKKWMVRISAEMDVRRLALAAKFANLWKGQLLGTSNLFKLPLNYL